MTPQEQLDSLREEVRCVILALREPKSSLEAANESRRECADRLELVSKPQQPEQAS